MCAEGYKAEFFFFNSFFFFYYIIAYVYIQNKIKKEKNTATRTPTHTHTNTRIYIEQTKKKKKLNEAITAIQLLSKVNYFPLINYNITYSIRKTLINFSHFLK